MQFLKKFTSKEPAVENFLALNISEESLRVVVWTVDAGQTRVVKLGPTAGWEGKDKESLLAAADRSLSAAGEGIKPEPAGVIFGLPESWTEADSIVTDKKVFLKHICQELELKPLGFVVTDTALIAYLKAEEGTPLSAVLIQLNSGEINLTLVKLGKIVGRQLVGRSGDLGADAEEGLSRMEPVEALPARIIIYNGGDSFEEARQQLLSYDWEEKLPFIHFPKVETLTSETVVKAVAMAGGSEVAQSLGIEIRPAAKDSPAAAETTAVSLGFVSNRDAAVEEKKTEAVPEPEAVKEEPTPVPAPDKPPWPLWLKLKQIKIPRIRIGGRWPVIAAAGFTIVLTGLLIAYWNIPKARVTVYLKPQLIDQELELQLDPEAETVAADQGVLPVRATETAVSGEKTVTATGTRTIGDPAKGGITVYNKTAAVKTFSAGSILLGGDNLAFSLDEETTVASRSAEEDSEGVITITPGKAEAGVTAVNIGPESNLAADSRLSFKQFSEDDYYAKTGGLSGGSAREVQAVSAADWEKLEKDLSEELIAKAQQELKSTLAGDQELIRRQDRLELENKSFSAKEGEAADNVTLSAGLNYQVWVYRRPELELLLAQAVKDKVPENFIIGGFTRAEPQETSGRTLLISYQAKLLPRLDIAEIKTQLRGRYPEKVEAFLKSLPQFVSADIKITPKLPKTLKTFPRVEKNIIVEVVTAP